MPTPDYTRGWKAALAEAARQFDAAGWRSQAGHLRALDREANIAAAYASEPAPTCHVGGPPPVPGIGWGVEQIDNPWVLPIVAVQLVDDGWVVVVEHGGGRTTTDSLSCAALYLPHAPADAPCWRRE